MTGFSLPKLYPITDARLTGLSHASQVKHLLAGGATLIQLREKQDSPRDFYEDAREALRLAHERGARLLINDRVDLALALQADGVHLGQDDLPVEEARKILGREAVIGYSTHNVEQAIEAARLPIDYLAVGPIYATSTKENPDPVVGLEGLSRVRRAVTHLPLVAIGGITLETAPELLRAGADSVAVIHALLASPAEIEERTRRFLELL
ncbi:MAG: thiamine phosphate synthase, partial [Acidobacteria bacterium]|nr:thiamine phosphate synthase [Acidobacteriota bacterium]